MNESKKTMAAVHMGWYGNRIKVGCDLATPDYGSPDFAYIAIQHDWNGAKKPPGTLLRMGDGSIDSDKVNEVHLILGPGLEGLEALRDAIDQFITSEKGKKLATLEKSA